MSQDTNATQREPSAEDIEALRELEAKATPGPWTIVNSSGDTEVHAGSKSLSGDTQYYPWTFDIEDTRLIVALRNAAPALLAAYAERDALKEQLDRLAKDLYAENVAASELRVERDALKAEVAQAYANAAHHADRAQTLSAKLSASEAEVERLRGLLMRISLVGGGLTARGYGRTPVMDWWNDARAALRGEEVQ